MIKIGDFVEWEHQKSSTYHQKTFIAQGKVLRIFDSIIGAKVKTKVASIKLVPHYYWKQINRKITTIKLNKLNLVNKAEEIKRLKFYKDKKRNKKFVDNTYEKILAKQSESIKKHAKNLKEAETIGVIRLDKDSYPKRAFKG